MTRIDRLKRVGAYFLNRLREPTTYIGLTKMIAAGSWNRMDGTSKGELAMQAAIFLIGAVEALIPETKLYRSQDPK